MAEQYGDLDYDSFQRIGDPQDRKSARRVIIDKTLDSDEDEQEIYPDGSALVMDKKVIAILGEILFELKEINAGIKHITS